jgi:glycosyltransferase involved in cell wall biosynthesis
VLQYLPFLKKEGVDASIHFYKRSWLDKLKFYNTLGQYDIFYVHRKLFLPSEFWYIRRKAKKIVYDFDDAVMYRSSSSKNPYSLSKRIRFVYMMKRIDFVVAGNEFLKSEVLPYNPHVMVIPTSIDLSRYTVKEDFSRGGPITIGWLGSRTTLRYLRAFVPIFERIYQKCPNTQLKMVCDGFLDSPHVSIIEKRWSSDEEEGDLKSFDIGVMPLSNDLWSKGKCGLKILQYFSVGVPAVCTPVGVNKDIVKDGVNGFWAQDEDQWESHLIELIQDAGLRKEMGLRGRETVEKGYSLEVNASRILDVLKQVHAERGSN